MLDPTKKSINSDVPEAIPQVSVIIPLYNKAPYIKRALDSVLAQTIQDFEIIVVNDGSTDGGEKVVTEINDSRIHLINQENQGVSAARNQGVDAASADLVAFLDADDEWLPEFLETILRLRDKWPNAGLYGTGYSVFNSRGSYSISSIESEQGEHLIQSWFSKKNKYGGQIILTSAMAIPKNTYQILGGFPIDSIQNEDRYLRARIALSYPIAYSPHICAIYHIDMTTYYARFNMYLSDPFCEYMVENQNELITRIDYNDIVEFCDTAYTYNSSMNLIAKHDKTQIRQYLLNIKSKRYLIEKYSLIVVSHIPYKIMCYFIKHLLPLIDTIMCRIYHPNS